jgi:hypothetical protein
VLRCHLGSGSYAAGVRPALQTDLSWRRGDRTADRDLTRRTMIALSRLDGSDRVTAE